MTALLSTGVQFSNATQTSRAGIKSVQTFLVGGESSLSGDYGASTAINVTINAVNTSKSFILHGPTVLYMYYNNGYFYYYQNVTFKFIDSTTVQLSKTTTYGITYPIRVQVVEFY